MKFYFFLILIILYFIFILNKILKIKEHMSEENINEEIDDNKKKKKKKMIYGSYDYIAKKGNVKGSHIGDNIGMTGAGIGYGIYLFGDLAKYLIDDVPKEILSLSDNTANDPIGQIFG